jgi:hypothetical protein
MPELSSLDAFGEEITPQKNGKLQLIAIGCSGAKHDTKDPVEAVKLYKGGYWGCKRNYGQANGDDFRIISAEHDLLHPLEEIEKYERVPEDLTDIAVHAGGDKTLPNGDRIQTKLDLWAFRVSTRLKSWVQSHRDISSPPEVTVQVLLGKKYLNPLQERDVFSPVSNLHLVTLEFPFQEVKMAQGGRGQQMKWMSNNY